MVNAGAVGEVHVVVNGEDHEIAHEVEINAEEEVEGELPPQGDGRVLLAPYLDPPIPGPSPVPAADGRGWNSIDSLGALESLLCQFGMLAEVPFQFEAGWRRAWETVLLSWDQAETELDETRALKWMLFLPQALLRRPREGR